MDDDLIFETLSHAPDEEQGWVWRNRIPRDKVTVLNGDWGLGKTRAIASTLACIFKGEPFPDGEVSEVDQGHVFFLTMESNLSELRRVFKAQGFTDHEMDYIHRIPGIRKDDDKNSYLDLNAHTPILTKYIERFKPIMIVIDPLASFTSINDIKTGEVRRLMSSLDDLCQMHDLSIIAIIHWNKDEKQSVKNRMAGSHQYGAAAKCIITVRKEKESSNLISFDQLKNNLGPMPKHKLSFIVEESQGMVIWTESLSKTTDGQLNKAMEWLKVMVAEGPVPVQEILKTTLFSPATIHRAKLQLGLQILSKNYYVGSYGKKITHWDLACERNLWGVYSISMDEPGSQP